MRALKVAVILFLLVASELLFAGGNTGEGVGTRPKADFNAEANIRGQVQDFVASSRGSTFDVTSWGQGNEPKIPSSTPEFVVEGVKWVESMQDSTGFEVIQLLYKAKADLPMRTLKLRVLSLDPEIKSTLLKSKNKGGSWELLINRKGQLSQGTN